MIVKKEISCVILSEITDNESVWCQIDYYGFSTLVGVVYRPPSSPESFLENIQLHMEQIYKPIQKIILAGDFNLPSINWSTFQPGSTEEKSCHLLLELMLNFNLSQLVTEGTRISQNSNNTHGPNFCWKLSRGH